MRSSMAKLVAKTEQHRASRGVTSLGVMRGARRSGAGGTMDWSEVALAAGGWQIRNCGKFRAFILERILNAITKIVRKFCEIWA